MAKNRYEGIRQRGKTYSFRYETKGEKGERRVIEKGGFLTAKEAKDERTKAIFEYNADPNKFIKSNVERKLESVFNEFIEKRAKLDRELSTIKRYYSIYKNHLSKWGNKDINNITDVEITDYLYSLSETHANSYIKGIEKTIKVIFYYADEMKYLKTNIVENIKSPKSDSDQCKIKTISDKNLDILEDRFSTTNLLPAYKIGRALGIRCGECFGLLWSDIDWDKHTIRITKQLVREDGMWTLRNLKTRASLRLIDLQDDIYNYLKALKAEQERQKDQLGTRYKETKVMQDMGRCKGAILRENLDFINIKPDGELLTPDSAKVLSRIAKDLNIEYSYHMLRHTHASKMVEMGVPIVVVKNRLGHAKIETTLRYYTHTTEEMRKSLMDKLNNK